MSVFLRWGVFGILGVAALLYAYNASKRLAESHAGKEPPAVAAQSVEPTPQAEVPVEEAAPAPPKPVPETPRSTAPPHCEAELVVAQRAIELRKEGAPLDRVLRMQEIAFQEPAARRQRLELVATRYYNYEGDFHPEALRIGVISDCVMHSPAP